MSAQKRPSENVDFVISRKDILAGIKRALNKRVDVLMTFKSIGDDASPSGS